MVCKSFTELYLKTSLVFKFLIYMIIMTNIFTYPVVAILIDVGIEPVLQRIFNFTPKY